jgi:hypothetical protein
MTSQRANSWMIGRIPTVLRDVRERLAPMRNSVSVMPVLATVCRSGATSWIGAKKVLATEARTNKPMNHGTGAFVRFALFEVVVADGLCVKRAIIASGCHGAAEGSVAFHGALMPARICSATARASRPASPVTRGGRGVRIDSTKSPISKASASTASNVSCFFGRCSSAKCVRW